MTKTILIIGTLDSKAKELNYLRQRIEAEGVESLMMDVSCKFEPCEFPSDISCKTVAEEGGKDFLEIAGLDKISAVKLMMDGAIKIVKKMAAEKKCHGVIGLGGANGAEIACGVMRELPVGFPKLMVTCVASGNVRPYVGTKDIIMANSIGDISLNRITKRIIDNAARAIAQKIQEGTLKLEDINEDCVAAHLYMPDVPDPDLLIRTAGERRISNFLLWQISYAEIYVTSVLWPEFRRDNLHQAILDYCQRDRRFGGLKKTSPA